ncbi:YceI-like domain-containing protein [Pustulibacterium marinum]|uniref:YceI-like domain-containing protein n=1 Tax=Pustulibacterium marinum TaxID=1224947 RepID=A0A1I7GPV2_9FLAO|nr:YceI family protein [Pustulibacterium marinum]SFU50478.1 YceI-like domain-containing protein [Pustulibacterium marinum]
MRKISFYILIICCLMQFQTWAQANVSVTVKTNVNSFECECSGNDFVYKDTFLAAQKKSMILFPMKKFDCPKKLMEKDLQELFEADEFPYAKLQILELSKSSQVAHQSIKFSLTLKNKTQIYTIPLLEEVVNNQLYIKGDKIIKLDDFGIKAPSKMLGMVKVDNQVAISFTIPEKQLLSN